MKNSIGEKIRMLEQIQSSLAQDVRGEQKFSGALTLDDFRFLFE